MTIGVKRKKETTDTLGEIFGSKKNKSNSSSYAFLETINKRKLDFDLEKICSVTLSHLNVYCCLVCGKYFQGRGDTSPAFLHSVNENHHVFMNVNSLKVYLLPDGSEVDDQNEIQVINSIRYALRPVFTRNEITHFPLECRDLTNRSYINGFIGLNNASDNDCTNVIIMMLGHLPSIRDYLLLLNPENVSEFVRKLSIVIRRLWSVSLFKQHVSVDEFLSFASISYKRSFISEQDPRSFLLWLINSATKTSQKLKDVLIEGCQGRVEINETPFKSVEDLKGNVKEFIRDESNRKTINNPFWILTLDLPPRPLFKDSVKTNSLPQIQLSELLKKFNGVNGHQLPRCVRKYSLKKLPKYLMLHFDRFDKDDHAPIRNRNQTIIEFPMIIELEKHKYALVTNIVHEPISRSSIRSAKHVGDDTSHWKIQVRNPKTDHWFEIDGSTVRLKDKELLFLSESYLQVWEKIGGEE